MGNSLEVIEAIDTLRGAGPLDFEEHCVTVAAHMLWLGEKAATLDEAELLAREVLASGAAWDRWVAMVAAQGGDTSFLDAPEKFPRAPVIEMVGAPQSGTVAALNAGEVGLTVVALGGGRTKKGDAIDHAVGVVLQAKVGERLAEGEPLFEIHAASQDDLEMARARLLGAVAWSDAPVEPLPLFYDLISSRDTAEP